MQNNLQRAKGLISIANKAGYLIIGSDNLKNYNKKLYLIVKNKSGGKNLNKIAQQNMLTTNCEVITLDENNFDLVVNIPNCKIVGIKNKGISDEIIKYIRSENIG